MASTPQGPPTDQRDHGERFGAFIGLGRAATAARISASISRSTAPGLFGPARVDDLARDHAVDHARHGKFFGIDEHGEEPSVPVRDLIRLLVENGYYGAISSEYEGWHWNYWQSPFDIIRAEQAVQRSAAADAGSPMITDVAEARTQLDAHLAQRALLTSRSEHMTMTDGIAGTGIELGITLYSLTSEFAAGLYTPETLIKAVAEEGIGPGVEFNIAQMLRTYPDVDDEFVTFWRDPWTATASSRAPSAPTSTWDAARTVT